MKWNESGFRPPLCTYRLNWARRTSWGWWDDWDDTFLQTQDSKFEPWRSEAEHATSRSRRLPTILTFTHGRGRNIFCFFQTAENGNRTPNSGVKSSGANHYPRAPSTSKRLFFRIKYVRSWVVGLPNHPQLRNYMTLSIMILLTLLWFLESGWLNKRWPYVVLALDKRCRQWPRMKYNHVVTSAFIIPSKH